MAVDKFKFVSPGIFIDEIDESILEPLPERMGPLIIGRFQKGPGMRPVKVNSFKEFVAIYGPPSSGNPAGDVWRDGEMTAPTYAAYAAQAWLKNNQPATIYRVMGEHSQNATNGAEAGWKTDIAFADGVPTSAATAGGAYGMFIMPNPDSHGGTTQATVAIGGTDALEDENSTILTLINADGNTLTFTTSNSMNYNQAPEKDSTYAWTFGTALAATAAKATQALHIALEAARVDGALNMTLTPASYTSETSFTLTQDTKGDRGNTAVTAPAGVTVAGGASGADGAFSDGTGPAVTGTLAAIWYLQAGAPLLQGTARDATSTATDGECARLVKSSNGQWTVKITGSQGILKTATFNFQRDSQNFIRKVFNTNPTLTNGNVTETGDQEKYWLGETFESNVTSQNSQLKVTGTAPTNDDQLGVILALDGTSESDIVWGTRKQAAVAAQTGWFFSQDIDATVSTFDPTNGTRVKNLFKFHALDSGEHANRDYKISIMDIKPPTDNFNKYGTFTVLVRSGKDSDNVPIILERFSNLNLNPNSLNYIGRTIGDRHFYYSEDNKTITELGNYPNRSKYVRVEVSANVSPGNEGKDGLMPFGVRGPIVPKTEEWLSGTTDASLAGAWYAGSGTLGDDFYRDNIVAAGLFYTSTPMTASIEFPTTRLRVSSSEGSLSKGTKAFFGYQSNLTDTRRHDDTNSDLLRGSPSDHTPHALADDGTNQYSWVFTLDDVCTVSTDTTHAYWASGSRASNSSLTAVYGSTYVLTGTTAGFDRFTSPMFGGFDGFDITERDPFRNRSMSGKTDLAHPPSYSLRKAIDMTSDPEFVEFDLATMPGITNSSLNTSLINMCEERADALAIVDLYGGYEPPHETTGNEQDNLGSVEGVVASAKDMGLNTSYGCTFYPFVQIRDTLSDSVLYVPPSVVALGTFSSSQRKSDVWFAPAGFTRGGLSEGSAGLPVLSVRQRLTSDNRDRLYEANINPIASFPAEGVVIFGQKTLQVTQSALDRINVRRLLIYVKKEISRFAATTLFEPHVQATWNSFKGKVEPFLDDVKAGFGLVDYRVILDETTTTPDLIDRNVLYAKIYLKPARAIEFIALDFIITKSGASFDD